MYSVPFLYWLIAAFFCKLWASESHPTSRLAFAKPRSRKAEYPGCSSVVQIHFRFDHPPNRKGITLFVLGPTPPVRTLRMDAVRTHTCLQPSNLATFFAVRTHTCLQLHATGPHTRFFAIIANRITRGCLLRLITFETTSC